MAAQINKKGRMSTARNWLPSECDEILNQILDLRINEDFPESDDR